MQQSPSWEANQSFQLVKKFPAFYGTRRFFTVLTIARHLSISWANSIQSPQPPPTCWRSILILSSHLRLGLPNGSFPQVFPPTPCAHLSPPPYTQHAPTISFFSILPPAQYWVRNTASTNHCSPNSFKTLKKLRQQFSSDSTVKDSNFI
jgi:hypothetical protein